MNKLEEKPNAAALGWKVRANKIPFHGEVFDVREDTLAVDGREKTYAYVARPEAVVVVPVTPDGQIVTVRQYRYPTDQWCIEVPAGGTHDTGDESLAKVARDELEQEVGATAETLTHIASFYTSPSLTTEMCHVFLADNVRLDRKPDAETTEEIEVQAYPAGEVLRMAREGEMKTAPCALGVLLCEPALRRLGFVG
jgi:ADP-ribose pyrophosphatase